MSAGNPKWVHQLATSWKFKFGIVHNTIWKENLSGRLCFFAPDLPIEPNTVQKSRRGICLSLWKWLYNNSLSKYTELHFWAMSAFADKYVSTLSYLWSLICRFGGRCRWFPSALVRLSDIFFFQNYVRMAIGVGQVRVMTASHSVFYSNHSFLELR